MSTTPTPATRTQKGRLSKRSKALVTAYWTNLTRYLAPPVAAWRWGESGLREPLKHKLKHRELIHRSECVTGHWETSEKLWLHVVERAGDEPVGVEATGQLTLDLHADIPRRKPGEPRVEPSHNHIRWFVQESLGGEPVPVSNLQGSDLHPKITTPRWRDPNKPTRKERAAQHPAQASLEAWSFGRGWVVNPASNAGLCVARGAIF